MKKLSWKTSAFVLTAFTVSVAHAQTTTTEEVVITEPAFKKQDKPLIKGGKETRIPYSPIPIFRQRLTNSLEQIDTGVSKGWVTSDVAAGLKQQASEIAPLIDKIKDVKGADKPLVDAVESKLTALNAAVHAAFNEKQSVKPAAKTEVKTQVPPAKQAAKTTVAAKKTNVTKSKVTTTQAK